MTIIKNLNGVPMEMSAEEEAEHKAFCAQVVIERKEEEKIEEKRKVDKDAGNQKLLDLGLTQDEVDALLR